MSDALEYVHFPERCAERAGDWMQTFTGVQFWPLDPHLDEIVIEDIAHALAHNCRYNGHCLRFYSVAEHCVHVSRSVPYHLQLSGLLHDASEAYLADIPRPIKPWLANYADIEKTLEECIAEKYGLIYPWHPLIKVADESILADEQQQNMEHPPANWNLRHPPLGVTLQFWSPDEAEHEFLKRFRQLRGSDVAA